MSGATTIIGLAGRKRTGKDTIGKRLIERHGFVRLAFADPLKEAALALDPIVSTDLGGGPYRLSDAVTDLGWEEAKGYPEVRRTLQRLGIAMREVLSPDIWLDPVDQRLYDLYKQGHRRFVITDVRLPNEVQMVRDIGGAIVKVERPGFMETEDQHVSETSVDTIEGDHLIVNTELTQLHADVDRLAQHLIERSNAA